MVCLTVARNSHKRVQFVKEPSCPVVKERLVWRARVEEAECVGARGRERSSSARGNRGQRFSWRDARSR